MSQFTNRSITNLQFTACLLLDMPEGNGTECSIYNENECVRCPLVVRFGSGEDFEDYGGTSHIICVLMALSVILIGIFGALANILIMYVLKNRTTHRGFDTMLIALAIFDLICCVVAVIHAFFSILYYQNLSRNLFTVYLFWFAWHSTLFGRSLSSFQTVLITFERFLIVVFPMKTSGWFTVTRARIMNIFVFIFSLLMAIPRYTSVAIDKNRFDGIDSTKNHPYLIYSSKLERFWYKSGGYFNRIDFWAPLPLLLVFNGLIYLQILRLNRKRKELNLAQRKDIRAVKMFLPVVVVLFLCNIIPIIYFASIVLHKSYVREIHFGALISYVVNAAVNLPIYYYRGSSFRQETRAILTTAFPFLNKYFAKYEKDETEGTSKNNTSGIDTAAVTFSKTASSTAEEGV